MVNLTKAGRNISRIASSLFSSKSSRPQASSVPAYEEQSKSHDKALACSDDLLQSSSTKDSPPPYSELEIKGDDLCLLSQYDTIFLVDDSLSMGFSTSDGRTRWNQARDCLMKFAAIAAQYDSDGIDVYFLNNKSEQNRNLNISLHVQLLFDSVTLSSGSQVGRRLAELTREYCQELSACAGAGRKLPQPRNYIVITDGCPTDPQDLKGCLEDTAAMLYKLNCPPSQLGFQFVQVGNSRSATKFLEELDGDKQKLKRDIVDTVKHSPQPPGASMSHDDFLIKKILLGGINRFCDRGT